MEKISNKEDQLKKLREKKKQTKEKKRFKQKERKLEEMIEKLPKKQINNHFMGKKEKKKLKKKILAKKIKSDEGQIVKIVKLSERVSFCILVRLVLESRNIRNSPELKGNSTGGLVVSATSHLLVCLSVKC